MSTLMTSQDLRGEPLAHRWSAIAISLALVLLVATTATGQEASSGPGIQLRSGTCDDPGDVVALLSDLPASDEAERDAIATSVTQVPLVLRSLLDESHVITIADATADAAGTCATITGPLVEDEGVAAPLVDASGALSGVAWLTSLGEASTLVHVFALPSAGGNEVSEPAPTPSPSPAPSAEPDLDDDGIVPGQDIDPSEDIDVDVTG